MVTRRTFYAWNADGKFYLSVFQAGNPNPDMPRPFNVYDGKAELEKEVTKRRGYVVWEDG